MECVQPLIYADSSATSLINECTALHSDTEMRFSPVVEPGKMFQPREVTPVSLLLDPDYKNGFLGPPGCHCLSSPLSHHGQQLHFRPFFCPVAIPALPRPSGGASNQCRRRRLWSRWSLCCLLSRRSRSHSHHPRERSRHRRDWRRHPSQPKRYSALDPLGSWRQVETSHRETRSTRPQTMYTSLPLLYSERSF
jgi:hypothetical protein